MLSLELKRQLKALSNDEIIEVEKYVSNIYHKREASIEWRKEEELRISVVNAFLDTEEDEDLKDQIKSVMFNEKGKLRSRAIREILEKYDSEHGLKYSHCVLLSYL